MKQHLRHPAGRDFEVFVIVKDRKRLARLIEIQGVSCRDVARAAGWKSHTYLLRLLSGKATSLEPGPALLIAAYLEVDVYDIFTPKVSRDAAHNRKKVGTAA